MKSPENLLVVVKLLQKYYPDAHCALHHRNAFELLVATILSAQCTDERVNQVTPFLFGQFPTPQKMSNANLEDLELHLRTVNFYKNKAKNLKACATALVEKHSGQVPNNLEALIELAGVGRKTANVVLGNAFNKPAGLVVDTHVARLSFRLGWVKATDPVEIESKLGQFIPIENWVQLPHELIFHGRQVCKARSPKCESCFLFEHCPKKGVSKL